MSTEPRSSRHRDDEHRQERRHRRSSPPLPPHRQAGDRRPRSPRPPAARPSSRFPPRPPPNYADRDPSIQVDSFAEYRRLKRIKLAQESAFLIWERSPSPQPEPLLASDVEDEADTRPADTRQHNPEEEALDQEEIQLFLSWLEKSKEAAAEAAERLRKEEEEKGLVGPTLPAAVDKTVEGGYGINLRPGEGERMAAFAKQGQRIPRRGEVGMTSEQIARFENIGYVMSGSRHSRMNAIRMRKENQVYTAEEKAALALFNAEEAKRKEENLISEMKKLVDEAIGSEHEQREG